MKKQRPINLDLTTMSFPVPAIASILHRISGLVIFIMTPVLLCWLQSSLKSAQTFQTLVQQFNSPVYKLLWLGFLAALIYHIIAGIRHIIMDMGYGETLAAGRMTAQIAIVLSIILTVLMGIWIW